MLLTPDQIHALNTFTDPDDDTPFSVEVWQSLRLLGLIAFNKGGPSDPFYCITDAGRIVAEIVCGDRRHADIGNGTTHHGTPEECGCWPRAVARLEAKLRKAEAECSEWLAAARQLHEATDDAAEAAALSRINELRLGNGDVFLPPEIRTMLVEQRDEAVRALRACVEAMEHAACVLDTRGCWEFFHTALAFARRVVNESGDR